MAIQDTGSGDLPCGRCDIVQSRFPRLRLGLVTLLLASVSAVKPHQSWLLEEPPRASWRYQQMGVFIPWEIQKLLVNGYKTLIWPTLILKLNCF